MTTTGVIRKECTLGAPKTRRSCFPPWWNRLWNPLWNIMIIVSPSTLPAAMTIQARWHENLAPMTLYLLFASLPAKVQLALLPQVVLRMWNSYFLFNMTVCNNYLINRTHCLVQMALWKVILWKKCKLRVFL
jgi:hypothetical protein